MKPDQSSRAVHPSKEQRHIIEGSTEVVKTLIDAIRPGVTPRQLAVLGEKTASRYAAENVRTGSGIFGHEMGTFYGPHIIPGSDPGNLEDEKKKYATQDARMFQEYERIDMPYEPGQLIAVEAFMSHKGIGNSGLEDHVLVTEDGCEWITKAPFYI